MFSGGSYEDVARWLRNFLTSHAKREDPRLEVVLEAGGARDGATYAARLRLGERLSPPIELDYKEVADNRGTLAWCAALAEATRNEARALLAGGPREDAPAR